ncbi:hypothetical protein LSCM4_02875 [Leishmania orientalis]|uniref:Uncharacterized protein n=1 Tax=Leishmania orientalis TaxID=2249476 RepID=A0A836KDT6_9TRYP|nr:hypothetical protein LSCM4_02875 [Leishmania orientalis]
MQQYKPQVLIVPAENQADFSASARPYKGEISHERGPAVQQPESQWSFDVQNCTMPPQRNEADVQGQQRLHEGHGSDAEDKEESPYPELKVDDAPYAGPDNLPMLWTMDEETVLMHSSQVSLERIRTRLETLLLGVSDAIRVRKMRRASQDGPEEKAPRSQRRCSGSHREVDFREQVLAADHAFRRIFGEAFDSFAEREALEMLRLCLLADKGAPDCYELVSQAVAMLQTLMHGGEALRDLAHFRQFVLSLGSEISSQKWHHDFVTALRSFAVGFLRHPKAIMAFYGHSVNHIVQHEALYVALLRICGRRAMGSALAPLNNVSQAGHTTVKKPLPNRVATTRSRASRIGTPTQLKQGTSSVHKRGNESGLTRMQQPSISRLDAIMKFELPRCVTSPVNSTLRKRRKGASKSRRGNTSLSRLSACTGQEERAQAPRKMDAQASPSTSARRAVLTGTKLIPRNASQLILPCTINPSLLHY